MKLDIARTMVLKGKKTLVLVFMIALVDRSWSRTVPNLLGMRQENRMASVGKENYLRAPYIAPAAISNRFFKQKCNINIYVIDTLEKNTDACQSANNRPD